MLQQCFVSSCLHVIICRRDRSFIYRKLFPIHFRSDTKAVISTKAQVKKEKKEFWKSSSENREKTGKKKCVGSDWASQRRRRETNYASEISPGKREQPVRTWQQFCLSLFSPPLFSSFRQAAIKPQSRERYGVFRKSISQKKQHIS